MLDILEMQTIKHVKLIVSQAVEMSFFSMKWQDIQADEK